MKRIPSPFGLSIILTFVIAGVAFFFGNFDPKINKVIQLSIWWQTGFWDLLKFAMQMALMILLGSMLANSRPVQKLINTISDGINSGAQAVVVITFVAVITALLNWGLGLIVAATLCRLIAERLSQRNIKINYPLMGAAAYTGLMVWHGGLSGSAPLKIAESGHRFEAISNIVGVKYTLLSGMNITVCILLLIALPAAAYVLNQFDSEAATLALKNLTQKNTIQPPKAKEKTELLPKAFGFAMIITLIIYIGYSFSIGIHNVINPNTINMMLFAACLMLYPSLKSISSATSASIDSSSGILIQFPIYAGIMGIMAGSGMIMNLSNFFISISDESSFPLLTLLSAGLVNCVVPSGGGQWAIQGGVVLNAAQNILGDNPESYGKAVMALAYGDELTNMLQPFWAIPLLSITKLKASQILPYTLVFMSVGIVIYGTCLVLF